MMRRRLRSLRLSLIHIWLGFSSYQIGQSVAPGVPVMIPMENPDIRLVLKSGNFGQEDFFERVLAMTEMEED